MTSQIRQILRLYLSFLFLCTLIFAQEGKVVIIKVLPERVVLHPGNKCKFVAKAYDASNREIAFAPEWSCTGGKITPDGWYVAGNKSGIYTVMASDPSTGAQGSAAVILQFLEGESIISNTQKIAKLELVPSNVTLKTGEKIRFVLRAYNSAGKPIRASGRFRWHVTGGAITREGIYQAGGAPGVYIIQVKEPGGVTATATIKIQARIGKIVNIKITPSNAKLKPLSTQRFFATGYDSSGNPLPVACRWHATGGTIDSLGVYHAGSVPGNYFVKAIGPRGITSIVKVKIQRMEIARVQVSPKHAILYPGQTKQFVVRAYNKQGELVSVFPTWSATGGVIQSDGTYRAGNIPGNYFLTVKVDRFRLKIPITIQRKRKLSKLIITPSKVEINVGEIVQFKVQGYDRNGAPMNVSVQWLASGGSIKKTGEFRAGTTPGKYTVEAITEGGISAEAHVIIRSIQSSSVSSEKSSPTPSEETRTNSQPGPSFVSSHKKLQWLTLKPRMAKLTPGKRIQFIVQGVDKTGTEIPCEVSWKAQGGVIEKNGLYIAGKKEGKYLVTATAKNGITAYATVIITKNSAISSSQTQQLLLTPSVARIRCGDKFKFEAKLVDRNGNPLPGNFVWESQGGTIDAKGNFIAGNNPGEYVVTVKELHTQMQATARIYISAPVYLPQNPNSIRILYWRVGHGGALIGKIFIKGRIYDERAYMLHLVLFQKDGSLKVLTQLRIRNGQLFQFRGSYVRRRARAVGLILYDKNYHKIYTFQRST